jgi:hypothetical protein
MVTLDVTRVSGETLAESPESVQVNGQTLTLVGQGTASAPLRATRVSGEVLVKVPSRVQATGQSLTLVGQGGGSVPLRASRVSGEVLIDATPTPSVTAQSLTIVGKNVGNVPLRVTRVSGEILIRPPAPPPIPIPLPADLTWWLHNWVVVPTLTSSFSTDVTRSPEKGTEGRRALRAKPVRSAEVQIGPVEGRENVESLIRHAKRFVRERMVMPIFADVIQLTTAADDTDTKLLCDPRQRRFFNGGRIVVLTLGPLEEILAAQVYTIETVGNDFIDVGAALGFDYEAIRTVILPLIDVEQVGQTKFVFNKRGDVGTALINVQEISGDSALPALGLSGFYQHSDGRYVFPFFHNWAEDLEVTYDREGSVVDEGHVAEFEAEEEREHVVHHAQAAGDRETCMSFNRFFEGHMGRCMEFWHVDTECFWEVASWRPSGIATRVDLVPFGEFDTFVERLEETDFIGFFLKDGRVLVREVITKVEAASWQLTVSGDLPMGYSAADVEHVAVARLSRFDSDSNTEQWEAPLAGRIDYAVRELLNEGDVEL